MKLTYNITARNNGELLDIGGNICYTTTVNGTSPLSVSVFDSLGIDILSGIKQTDTGYFIHGEDENAAVISIVENALNSPDGFTVTADKSGINFVKDGEIVARISANATYIDIINDKYAAVAVAYFMLVLTTDNTYAEYQAPKSQSNQPKFNVGSILNKMPRLNADFIKKFIKSDLKKILVFTAAVGFVLLLFGVIAAKVSSSNARKTLTDEAYVSVSKENGEFSAYAFFTAGDNEYRIKVDERKYGDGDRLNVYYRLSDDGSLDSYSFSMGGNTGYIIVAVFGGIILVVSGAAYVFKLLGYLDKKDDNSEKSQNDE